MSRDQHSRITGDRALQAGDQDRLGFREIAARIAMSLVDHASDSGLVVGIDGAWGSGKSSLLYLIEDELKKLDKRKRPTIINFRPWLVGNRDALLADMFSMLAHEINKVAAEAGDATGVSKEKAKAAAEAFRKFAEGIGRVAGLVEIAGEATGLGPAKWAGKGIKALGDLGKKKSAQASLPSLKSKLVATLKDLGHRFIVTIDDVDRLEPSEVIEVLRLARSVADFPNVIYLLCYDSDILAHSIRKAAKVKSGHAYLEKIVQLTLMVPIPEAFQLRQWFTDDLHKIASVQDDDGLARLKAVIDYEGGRLLKTPRAVVRALDAIRFFWPPLHEAGADLADLVWLQLIKDANHSLYRWIEQYSAEAAVLSLGTATLGDADKCQFLAELLHTVDEHFFGDSTYRFYFAEHLPGLEANLDEDGTFDLFQRVDERERTKAIQNARLASPDHYRLYFALAGPAHAVTGASAEEIASAAETSSDEIGKVLLKLHNQLIATGPMGRADVLLERYKADPDVLSPVQCRNLLVALGDIMDDAYRARPFDIVWVNSIWDRAERLVPALLERLDGTQRPEALTEMFCGRAISWLSKLLRRETFAHGRFGNRKKPEQDWHFTDPELDQVATEMLKRYQGMSRGDLFALVDPLDVLFAWNQSGDEVGPKTLVGECIVTDEGLIDTLEKLTTYVSSSDRGTYSVLKRTHLDAFLDFDEAKARVEALAQHDGPLMERAKALAKAFVDAERD